MSDEVGHSKVPDMPSRAENITITRNKHNLSITPQQSLQNHMEFKAYLPRIFEYKTVYMQ